MLGNVQRESFHGTRGHIADSGRFGHELMVLSTMFEFQFRTNLGVDHSFVKFLVEFLAKILVELGNGGFLVLDLEGFFSRTVCLLQEVFH